MFSEFRYYKQPLGYNALVFIGFRPKHLLGIGVSVSCGNLFCWNLPFTVSIFSILPDFGGN